jgi:benzylsuccinate CoA-transferase BbsE subunit
MFPPWKEDPLTQATERPYDSLRIIDLTRELGAYATRLFADLGAEVIRVEPPSGRGDRGTPALPGLGGDLSFTFLNANKKSVALDLESEPGRAVLADLVATAGVVVLEGQEASLLPLVLSVPGARVVTQVSHFGLDGPYAGYLGSDLVTQSLGGIAWMSGVPGSPPLRIAAGQAGFVASLYAATATALALYDVEANGGGSHLIDVSAQECIAHSLQNALQVWDLEARIPVRGGEGTRDATEQVLACQDGHVFVASPLAMPLSWKALVDWIGEDHPEGSTRLSSSDWGNRGLRTTAAMHAEFRTIFEAFAADKTKAELRNQALKRRIIMAPVSGIADLPSDPQLIFRRYFHELAHPSAGRSLRFPGAPYRLSEPAWRIDRPAPLPGEHTGEVLGGGDAPRRSVAG